MSELQESFQKAALEMRLIAMVLAVEFAQRHYIQCPGDYAVKHWEAFLMPAGKVAELLDEAQK